VVECQPATRAGCMCHLQLALLCLPASALGLPLPSCALGHAEHCSSKCTLNCSGALQQRITEWKASRQAAAWPGAHLAPAWGYRCPCRPGWASCGLPPAQRWRPGRTQSAAQRWGCRALLLGGGRCWPQRPCAIGPCGGLRAAAAWPLHAVQVERERGTSNGQCKRRQAEQGGGLGPGLGAVSTQCIARRRSMARPAGWVTFGAAGCGGRGQAARAGSGAPQAVLLGARAAWSPGLGSVCLCLLLRLLCPGRAACRPAARPGVGRAVWQG
jgi:hypothetical protein